MKRLRANTVSRKPGQPCGLSTLTLPKLRVWSQASDTTFGDSAFLFSWPHVPFSWLHRSPKMNALLRDSTDHFLKGKTMPRIHFQTGKDCPVHSSMMNDEWIMVPCLASGPTLCPTFILDCTQLSFPFAVSPLSAVVREPSSSSWGQPACSTEEGTSAFSIFLILTPLTFSLGLPPVF